MTAAIFHGDPGCWKTSSLVSEYAIPALYQGRKVVSNIRGFNDLKKVENVYGKRLPESAEIIYVPFNRDGFRKMGTFFHWAPPGALILLDEVQRVYPTRLKSFNMYDCNPPRETGYIDPETCEPEDISTVEEAFDCHRHMNWDIYLATPNIEKVHKEIRQVAEWGYRQRSYSTVSPILKLILGDFKRVKHNAENKGNTESSALISTSHRIDKKVFRVYQSTATGLAKESHTKTSIFAQPKLLLLFGFVLFTIYRFADSYISYGTIFPSSQQIAEVDSKPAADRSVLDVLPVSHQTNIPQDSDFFIRDVPRWQPDQATDLAIVSSITGWTASYKRSGLKVTYQFEFPHGRDYKIIDSNELEYLGYSVKALNNFLVIYRDDFKKIVYPSRHQFVETQTMSFPQDQG